MLMLYNFFLLQNGKWNGLMAELVEKKFDMVLTSLKVNSEREAAVDFTSPFLESGTTILVARRTGIISPTGRSLTQLSSVFFSHKSVTLVCPLAKSMKP